MNNMLRILAVSALATACASAPDRAQTNAAGDAAARGELDPVGSYTFSTTVQGTAVDGQLRITGAPEAWGGAFYTPVTGELPLSSVDVDGQELRLTANTPDGIVYVRMMFSGETFTGNLSLGGDGGDIRGRGTGG